MSKYLNIPCSFEVEPSGVIFLMIESKENNNE